MRYSVLLIPEEGDTGRYAVCIPALPGCVTQGENLEDALAMAQDAATMMIESMIDHDEDVPIEPDGAIYATIEVTVPTPASAAA
jgi:predicted RNase H-like HicB family nuclease